MRKVWFITGSSRGFGRELVRAALDTGDAVVATARRPEQLADLATTYGERILPHHRQGGAARGQGSLAAG